MGVFEIISKYFPVITLIFILLNVVVWWIRGRASRENSPELKRSFTTIMSWFVGYVAVVCILFQLELLFGLHDTIFELSRATSLGAFGMIGFVLMLLSSPLLALYIYVFNGAEKLSKHSGLLSKRPTPIAERYIWRLLPVLVFISHAGFFIQRSKLL